MIRWLQLNGNRRAWILCIICIFLVSCQKEDSFTFEEQKSILMSTGWKLDRLIFHFQDNRPDEESDTLVLLVLRSDIGMQQMTVYTERWIVFEDDTLALSAYNLDRYSRPEDNADWELTSSGNTGVGWTDWGSGDRGDPYLSLKREWPVRIRMVSNNQLIMENAYRIETTEEIYSGAAVRTYRFTEYPPGTLESIDAVYLAAGPDEGPDWFPPWSSWPD